MIGGDVTGLAGSGLELALNGGAPLAVGADLGLDVAAGAGDPRVARNRRLAPAGSALARAP